MFAIIFSLIVRTGLLRTLVLTSLLFLISTALPAQKQWTLQESVEYAINNNISVKQTELNAEISSVNYKQSKLTMLPSINSSASYSYNFGRSVDPFTYLFTTREVQTANFSVSGNLAIFNGLQLQNSLAQSKYEYLAGKENVKRIKNDISLNVAAAYLQVLYGKEAVKAASDRLESATETRNRAKLMVDAGSMAQGNLLDAEAALAAEELAQINANNALTNSLIAITQLLELRSINEYDVISPAVELPDQSAMALSPDEIYQAALKNLPEFKASEYNIKSAEKGYAFSKGGRMPRLSLVGSVNSGYSNATRRFTGENVSFGDQLDENYNKSIGLNLTIPLFNGWSAGANVNRSRINLENVRYNDQLTRNQVYKSVVQAHADVNAALSRYVASGKASASATEAYIYAEKKFNVGMLSSIEFLNVRNTKSNAESDLLQAKYDLIFRIKVIDFYLGRPLIF